MTIADPAMETFMLPDDDLIVSDSEYRFRINAVPATDHRDRAPGIAGVLISASEIRPPGRALASLDWCTRRRGILVRSTIAGAWSQWVGGRYRSRTCYD